MSVAALSGSDTVVINGRLLANLADESALELTFPNSIAEVKVGKNGNSIYALNETGKACEVKMRVVRGSPDDLWLNNLLQQQDANFAFFVLMTGTFTKKIGDGAGNLNSDIYQLSGGIFSKRVEAAMNVAGNTDQSVAIYSMKFSNAPRALG